ncbi:polysaccharide biosynthesis protein [Candidatus Thioglobus sp.]|nr:polysaccharide biosynthesis protein [Candidatus Thioglobus sp.]
MVNILNKLNRKNKKFLMIIFDICALLGGLFFIFYLQVDFKYNPITNSLLLLLIALTVLLAIPIFSRFGLYHEVIRFFSFKALWNIIQAISLFSILLLLIFDDISLPLMLLFWLLAIIIIGSSRFFARWFFLGAYSNNNVVIFGAGSAGRQVSNALIASREYKPIAFIDNSKEIYLHSINGLKVYSQEDLGSLITKKNIKEVLIAIPSLSRSRRAEILDYLKHFPVTVRIFPGASELAQGRVTISDIKEIDLNDLLGREPVKPNKNLLKTNISHKVVMVTGAGGSIGSELCRQILSLKPKKLILFEVSESSLYQIDQELLIINTNDIKIFPVIGSVLDKDRMLKICSHFEVQTIYHAAAYKHVPLVEYNQSQGILNNTIGTLSAAKAAISTNVETFVLISTDKAVNPTNIMGASKRGAELVLQALSKKTHNTCFTMVRFGNVLDSSGSVIPLFKKQIKKGGPVTVTHRDIVRYFMTIPEAVELVVQAGAIARGGDVFVLDMGKAVRIYDLAVKMIQLSGLEVLDENNPKGDIEIKYTGLRPGEKLYEELLLGGEFTITENKLIMRAEEKMIVWEKLEPMLSEITEAAKNTETTKIYKLLKKIVPEFSSKSNGFDSF